MLVLDTNIISLDMKGTFPREVKGHTISSVTAHEFLESYSNDATRANYYLPTPRGRRHLGPDALSLPLRGQRPSHPCGKRATDQLILDLGRGLPSVIEFGSFAIAEIVNRRMHTLFRRCVEHLPRDAQRVLLSRFRYLLDSRVVCVPLTRPCVEVGLTLLSRFLDQHSPGRNLRNTVNDLLILGTALENRATLLTEDSLLSRFSAESAGVEVDSHGDFVSIRFADQGDRARRRLRESKGFIQRGWQVRARQTPGAW